MSSAESPPDHQPAISLTLGLALAGLAVGITFVIYFYDRSIQFLFWDDVYYLTDNPNLTGLSLESLQWMLTTTYFYNWLPLTWLSYAVDKTLWGLDPGMFRLTNVMLHILNAGLVYLLTRQVMLAARASRLPGTGVHQRHTGVTRIAGLVAFSLYLVHPQHVETVAWLSQRKEVLCALFYFSAMYTYLLYGGNRQKRAWLYVCQMLGLLALMSKPMAVSLPVALLLLDAFPLNRISTESLQWRNLIRLVTEKAVLIMAAAGVVVITLIAQQGAMSDIHTLEYRVANAAYTVLFYLEQFFLPTGLSPFHPFPDWLGINPVLNYLPIAFFIATSLILVVLAKRGIGYPLVAAGFILVTLLPTLGIVKVGEQAAADRYTYISLMPMFMMSGIIIAGFALHQRASFRLISRVFISAWLIFHASLAMAYIKAWDNEASLWTQVIRKYGDRVPHAFNNLGGYYLTLQNADQAIVHLSHSLKLDPEAPGTLANLAIAYRMKGDLKRSLQTLESVLDQFPDAAPSLETILAELRQYNETAHVCRLYHRTVAALDPRHRQNLAREIYRQPFCGRSLD